jgi:hypothetical protein
MRILKLLCATAGLLVIGSPAFAQFTIQFQLNPAPAPLYDITYQNHLGASITQTNTPAGSFLATIMQAPGFTTPDPAFSPFTTYCVDLEHDVAHPNQTTTTVPITVPIGSPNTVYDASLPGTFMDLQMASWLENNQASLNTALGINSHDGGLIENSALQLAIWDVIDHNTDYNVLTGQFRVALTVADTLALTDANLYLTALHNAVLSGADHGLSDGVLYDAVHVGNLGQDMLGPHGSPGTNVTPATPEGASLLLFLPGLIPVAIGLRRRRNNKE